MTYKMRQCRLSRGNTHTTSWIPQEFAVLGKVLKLKDNGEWSNGWRVDFVGPDLIDAEDANHQSQSYKKHRKFSDRIKSER